MGQHYMDFGLTKRYPNKYNLTPQNIKKLKILDWDKLKTYTWRNTAMTTGHWWCHLEGCQNKDAKNQKYCDFSEFWIGFNEDNNKIDLHFTTWEGMCSYQFDEFYKDCEDKYDLQVQVNTISYLNMLIDKQILGLP